jgi:WD40 repeat protein
MHREFGVENASFSPDGRLCVFCPGCNDQPFSLWDACAWKELRRIDLHGNVVVRAVFSSNGKNLIVGFHGGRIGVMALNNDQLTAAFDTPGFHFDRLWIQGDSVMATFGEAVGVYRLDLQAGRVSKVSMGSGLLGMTRDLKLGAVGTKDDLTIKIKERSTGRVRTTICARKTVLGRLPFTGRVAFSADGRRFAAEDKEGVQIWDLELGKLLHVIPEAGRVEFSPDSRMLFLDQSPLLRLWDVNSGQLRQTFGDDDSCSLFCVAPDGKRLVTIHCRSKICVWQARQ